MVKNCLNCKYLNDKEKGRYYCSEPHHKSYIVGFNACDKWVTDDTNTDLKDDKNKWQYRPLVIIVLSCLFHVGLIIFYFIFIFLMVRLMEAFKC